MNSHRMFKSVQKPIFNINSSKFPLYYRYIDARCQEIEVYWDVFTLMKHN